MTPSRIFDILSIQVKTHPLDKCLSDKRNGKWKSLSTQKYYESANLISAALIEMGVRPQDKIALISTTNRSEWSIMDMAILQVGAVSVPLYPNISSNDYKYILNHSESVLCFVSDQEIYDKVFSIESEVKGLKDIYAFDQIEGCKNWLDLIEVGKEAWNEKKLAEAKTNVESDSIATIIYTSGTTGVPKGVMLSHENIVSNVISATRRFPFEDRNQKALSFLPLCHIFERTFIYGYLYNSISVYFAESLETISENLNEVKPNFMTAVPRLLEKVYDKIYAKGNDLTGLKKTLFYWAVEVGLKYDPNHQSNILYNIKHWIAYKLILSKWKKALGGNLEIICSGSAPLQSRLARVFSAAGMTIAEAYGLTETSPAISVNDLRNGGLRIGTVGKIIDGIEVVIADDGEILCKGPNVMKGYFKDPDQTNAVMEGNYFKTGDIGSLDEDGFLKITDRKKQMFKTSGGKYIAPQVIESQLKQSLLIEQIMVVGEGKNRASALIQPCFEQAKIWLDEQGVSCKDDPESLCKNELLFEKINHEIRVHDHKFGKWEQVKEIRLTPEIWSIEAGHLTPTMKVKRKIVQEKYQSLVDEIYS
ncbi:MAG: long-chain fatty acid--CoA ligase [Flavobacteriaceae bacterium]|jgi:long-chain acyl-CoA synthetase|nr:long-chain fatty acid--CoA ligase [Flavobacteriaceae bacterium]MBT6128121.1 long-chain fatty acid--CoA ligase [Flavobacteriaceae bacterium]MDG1028608.1 long-chain fatty acid--CoA ligase [Flavobacteriaceae bacterium]MDG1941745.1 long-chain fatty acid--CoA ligase [Flavobacteriaceae bacterium]